MLYFIRHQGKEYRIRVESRQGQVHVSFGDEKEEQVDLIYYGNECSFIQANKVFYANVVGQKDDYTVWLPQGNLNLQLESEYRRIVGLLRGQDIAQENNVYAKMPGKIVKVLAKAGDHVQPGTAVMVMEAMKMENEIRAAIPGKVTNVCVGEGQAVETGSLLMELEPTEAE